MTSDIADLLPCPEPGRFLAPDAIRVDLAEPAATSWKLLSKSLPQTSQAPMIVSPPGPIGRDPTPRR